MATLPILSTSSLSRLRNRFPQAVPRRDVFVFTLMSSTEKAASGLIVTTSDISPDARTDCETRAYPITTANSY